MRILRTAANIEDLAWRLLTRGRPLWDESPGSEQRSVATARLLYASGLLLLLPIGLRIERLSEGGLPYPVALIRPLTWLPPSALVPALAGMAAAGLLAAALWPQRRPTRVFALLATTLWASTQYSLGTVSHGWHPWIWCYVALAWLPDSDRQGESKPRGDWCFAIWLSQALFMLSYSMAGLWKVQGACLQRMVEGQLSYLHLTGLSQQVADRVLESGVSPWLGHLVIETPVLGFVLIWAAIYLEFGALAAAFRPELHRLWGALLISMHIGIDLCMNLPFRSAVLLLGILMIGSPIARPASAREVSLSLPGIAALKALRGLRQNESRR